jgi:hypothetical protein
MFEKFAQRDREVGTPLETAEVKWNFSAPAYTLRLFLFKKHVLIPDLRCVACCALSHVEWVWILWLLQNIDVFLVFLFTLSDNTHVNYFTISVYFLLRTDTTIVFIYILSIYIDSQLKLV